MGLVRFTVKSTLAGGIVYYTYTQGLWSSTDKSAELYCRIVKSVCPYFKRNMPKEVMDELAVLPSTNDISRYVGSTWNKGVMTSLKFLADTPSYVSNTVNFQTISNLINGKTT
ncbi:hypothetical protein KM043_002431 [Ampulex compressa]|nr:hypothetical protein KM043_002431 [Ampulex compressa]